MSRRVVQERRVRAIAAVHALVGSAVVVWTIAWAALSATHAHGPSDLAAAALPILLGVAVAGGAIFVAVAGLLWVYNPIARWATGVLFAGASAMCVYLFVKYDVGFIM